MKLYYTQLRKPQQTFPNDIAVSRSKAGGSTRNISIEPSGKGSFQAVKLQRPARTTVCSHSIMDMAAMRSIESSAIITALRTSVCAVVHSHKAEKEPRSPESGNEATYVAQ